jgi:PmbA protein
MKRSSKSPDVSATHSEQLARRLVARAVKQGAAQAEAFLQVGRQSDVRVRDGEIEDLTQATSKGVGLRVVVKGRLGFAFTSDFEWSSLERFVDRTVLAAKVSAPNPFNGLPTKLDLGHYEDVGDLFDPAVASLAPDWKIKAAIEMEQVVRGFDPRIKTIDSVGAGEGVSDVYLASSEGASGSTRGTSVYLYASPVAEAHGQLQTSTWYDQKRFFGELDAPETIAREAARRALRLLGAKKVKSQRVPVVFDPSMAASFIGTIAAAASGDAVHKGASFLAKHLGKRLAPEFVTLVDDGRLPRGLGTSPFDGEGVPTRRNEVLGQGVLRTFLYDAFTARKAKRHSTGNASRGYRSLPHIGTHNLFLEPGARTPEDIIRSIPNGLYVTAMLGNGANLVTGEYSRGANGLWIENGELTQPVQEVTVGGSLLEMLSCIREVGNDLSFRSPTSAPTLCFEELAISGE